VDRSGREWTSWVQLDAVRLVGKQIRSGSRCCLAGSDTASRGHLRLHHWGASASRLTMGTISFEWRPWFGNENLWGFQRFLVPPGASTPRTTVYCSQRRRVEDSDRRRNGSESMQRLLPGVFA